MALLQRRFGLECARKIGQRLLELRAAKNLAIIPNTPPARCHELVGNRASQFSVDVKHPYRLIFIPEHDPIPRTADGGIDRSQVTIICILDVEDTH